MAVKGRIGIDTLLAVVIGAFTVIMKWYPVSIASSGGPSDKVRAIANAIATAEGFFAPGNNTPKSHHNPGDLTKLTGGIAAYATDEDGWNALYDYIQRMIDGVGWYNTGMTWDEIGRIYAAGPNATDPNLWSAWVNNVTFVLGVSASDTMGGYVNV